MGNVYTREKPITEPIKPHLLTGFTEIDVIIVVDLGEIINCGGIDGFNDIADEKVHNYKADILLCDIHYSVVGFAPPKEKDQSYGDVHIRVQGTLDPL